jgi:hypothetical protein
LLRLDYEIDLEEMSPEQCKQWLEWMFYYRRTWEILENIDSEVRKTLKHQIREREEDKSSYYEVCEKRRKAVETRRNKEKEKWIHEDTNVYKCIQSNTNDTNSNSKCNSKSNINKKENIKEKEITPTKETKTKYLDFVLLSDDEYSKLLNIFWKERLDKEIAKLNNYIGSSWKKYKSHYFTIRQRNQDYIQEMEKRKKELNTIKTDLPTEWLLWTIQLRR